MPHIIITGNPVDGFKYYGPYSTHAEAVEVAQGHIADVMPDWWVCKIKSIEAFPFNQGQS